MYACQKVPKHKTPPSYWMGNICQVTIKVSIYQKRSLFALKILPIQSLGTLGEPLENLLGTFYSNLISLGMV